MFVSQCWISSIQKKMHEIITAAAVQYLHVNKIIKLKRFITIYKRVYERSVLTEVVASRYWISLSKENFSEDKFIHHKRDRCQASITLMKRYELNGLIPPIMRIFPWRLDRFPRQNESGWHNIKGRSSDYYLKNVRMYDGFSIATYSMLESFEKYTGHLKTARWMFTELVVICKGYLLSWEWFYLKGTINANIQFRYTLKMNLSLVQMVAMSFKFV